MTLMINCKKKVSKGWIDENEIKVVEGLPKQLTDSFNRRLNLRNIASCLISDNFKTVDELREYFNNRYRNLRENFGKIYT